MAETHAGPPRAGASRLTVLACAAALMTLAGSLWLSIGMDLKACPLCFYQRTFVMAIVAVMVIGLLSSRKVAGALTLLSLPLACAGLGVAGFHVALELNGTLECPDGILGLGSAPQQSLVAMVVLTLILLADVLKCGRLMVIKGALLSAIVGGLLAYAAVLSSPPLPSAPSEPYATPLDGCRPPYVDAD